jgi:anti-sigma B factor antagonist
MTKHPTLTSDAHHLTTSEFRTVCTTDSSGAVVVYVDGEIDLATAPILWNCLTAQLHQAHYPVLVVDLADVDFLACAGLRVLLDVQCHAAAQGTTLRLTRCPRAVRRLLDVSDLPIPLHTYPTVEDALPSGDRDSPREITYR